MRETDVLIVGGGFVGLSLAAALGESRLQVTVLDVKEPPRGNDPQLAGDGPMARFSANVIAVSPGSQNFLADIGAWQDIPPENAPPYLRMCVADGDGAGCVTFSAEDEGLPCLGYIVDQAALTLALRQAVDREANANTIWGARWVAIDKVAGGHKITLENGDRIFARLLVGADGGASMVRESVGLTTWGWDYNQRAVVCLARVSGSHRQTAWQWFTETGPLAFLPMSDEQLSDEQLVAAIWSAEDWEDLLAMGDGEFSQRLTLFSEGAIGEVEEVGGRLGFPLMQRQALNYVGSGVAILGDAAHTIHPLAGQGANLGFADARCLALELGQARLEGKSPGELPLLRRYEKARRLENIGAGMAMEGFHRLFSSNDPLVKWLRNRSLSFADKQPLLKSLAVGMATGKRQA